VLSQNGTSYAEFCSQFIIGVCIKSLNQRLVAENKAYNEAVAEAQRTGLPLTMQKPLPVPRGYGLIIDDLRAHTNAAAQAVANRHGLLLIRVPPGMTAYLQPVDQGILRSLKHNYDMEMQRFRRALAMEQQQKAAERRAVHATARRRARAAGSGGEANHSLAFAKDDDGLPVESEDDDDGSIPDDALPGNGYYDRVGPVDGQLLLPSLPVTTKPKRRNAMIAAASFALNKLSEDIVKKAFLRTGCAVAADGSEDDKV
jgi:hypothetical protein